MNKPLIWVVGSGGLLGSHVRSALIRHFPCGRIWQPTSIGFSWNSPQHLAQELGSAVAEFAAATRYHNDSWALVWCAGNGTVSSPAALLEPEWFAWNRLLDLVGREILAVSARRPGYIVLSSSAGGIYGGNVGELISEDTPPSPVSAYGAHKLRMEAALRDRTGAFSNVSCLIGRISTLYGPGQNLRKPQGIISHLSRSLIHRRQVSIYVPLDTRRDYLFVDDCADQIAACLGRLMSERPRTVLKIMGSERLTSLAQIIGIFFRMSKHRSLIATRQARIDQSISLKFRSQIWRDMLGLRRTDLATGINLVHAHQLALFQTGLLPPPSYA